MKKFLQMDGAQSAAAFAYYAFFSLFPLIILIVTLASTFIDRDRAGTEVIAYVKEFVPISGEMQSYIFDTISGVINARGQVGIVAFLMLIWAAMQFFITLICAFGFTFPGAFLSSVLDCAPLKLKRAQYRRKRLR